MAYVWRSVSNLPEVLIAYHVESAVKFRLSRLVNSVHDEGQSFHVVRNTIQTGHM